MGRLLAKSIASLFIWDNDVSSFGALFQSLMASLMQEFEVNVEIPISIGLPLAKALVFVASFLTSCLLIFSGQPSTFNAFHTSTSFIFNKHIPRVSFTLKARLYYMTMTHSIGDSAIVRIETNHKKPVTEGRGIPYQEATPHHINSHLSRSAQPYQQSPLTCLAFKLFVFVQWTTLSPSTAF